MIRQVQAKLQKRMNREEIAEILEEPLETVERICAAIESCNTTDAMAVYERYSQQDCPVQA